MMPKVSDPRARAPRNRPGRSNRARTGSELSGRTNAALMKARTPKITLAQKMARHDHPKTRRPPISGPSASPRLDTAAQIPRERARSARSVYSCRIIERVPGSEAAAPMPMTTRPAISTSVVGATAAMTEPAQNTATPNRITFLRPNRSPMVPKLSIRLAKVRA